MLGVLFNVCVHRCPWWLCNTQDEVHARLKRLQPKHGVRECAVTGSHNLEADVSTLLQYLVDQAQVHCMMSRLYTSVCYSGFELEQEGFHVHTKAWHWTLWGDLPNADKSG